jgi:hypothetical protein
MELLYTIHSHTRWLIVAIVVLALVKLAITWSRGASFSGADRGLLSAAIGFIDLQMLMGVILLFGLDQGFPRYRIEHGVTMILAVAAAHFTAKWKKVEGPVRARNSFIALLIAAVLIFVGVMRLPGGWMRGME